MIPKPISREEAFRRKEVERQALENQRTHDQVNFSYLDLYEKQMADHRKAQAEFNRLAQESDREAEANKPAFFRDERKVNKDWREDEYEAWKKL